MKSIFKISLLVLLFVNLFSSCKKKSKNEPSPENPTPPNESEVITTFRFYIFDSISGVNIPGSPFTFKDPDGDGGTPGTFQNGGADSVITLNANTAYITRIVLLDETKNPIDSISNAVIAESAEHMLFYNNGSNTLVNGGIPYTVLLNGSNIKITYKDVDNGTPQRSLGLETYMHTSGNTGGNKYPLTITLRHQPGVKNGTFTPGETDVEITYKVLVQ